MGLLDVDLWQIGIVKDQAGTLIQRGTLAGSEIVWLPPEPDHAFLADPFGIMRGGHLHLFAEHYDYRTRRGAIDAVVLDACLNVIDRRRCLDEPWHLSYPFVFEAGGETWMLPEASASGALTLYRAAAFPFHWRAAARFALDAPAVDPTLFRHDGRWWLAYAPGGTLAQRQGHLHLAYADHFTGPWTPHPLNPVRIDRGGARPAGSVAAVNGHNVLPVQDCARTYGGAIRLLRIDALDPQSFAAAPAGRFAALPSFPARDGLHTLSACGPYTLIDSKRIDRSWRARTAHAAGFVRNVVAVTRAAEP